MRSDRPDLHRWIARALAATSLWRDPDRRAGSWRLTNGMIVAESDRLPNPFSPSGSEPHDGRREAVAPREDQAIPAWLPVRSRGKSTAPAVRDIGGQRESRSPADGVERDGAGQAVIEGVASHGRRPVPDRQDVATLEAANARRMLRGPRIRSALDGKDAEIGDCGKVSGARSLLTRNPGRGLSTIEAGRNHDQRARPLDRMSSRAGSQNGDREDPSSAFQGTPAMRIANSRANAGTRVCSQPASGIVARTFRNFPSMR